MESRLPVRSLPKPPTGHTGVGAPAYTLSRQTSLPTPARPARPASILDPLEIDLDLHAPGRVDEIGGGKNTVVFTQAPEIMSRDLIALQSFEEGVQAPASCGKHVQRVLVCDEATLVGLVSTFDRLAAVCRLGR